MTEEAQRIALAKWEGWTAIAGEHPFTTGLPKHWQGAESRMPLPTYTSLDDLHRIEERLTDEEYVQFRWILWSLCKADTVEQWHRNHLSSGYAKRRESILRALNLWTHTHE